MNNLQLIDFLNHKYGTCEFCSCLFSSAGRCRNNLPERKVDLKKCDECYLFNSKNAEIYQKVLKRYKENNYET